MTKRCFITENVAAFFFNYVTKLRSAENNIALSKTLILIVISVAENNSKGIFSVEKILGYIIFYAVCAE